MTKKIKFGFMEKKLSRKATFPLVASDKNAYALELDMSRYQEADRLYIYARRADGEVVCDSIATEGEMLSYTLKQNMYSVPGELTMRLVLESGDTVLTAAEIVLEVLSGTFEGTPAADAGTVEDLISGLSDMKKLVGDIDSALDRIIEVEKSLMEVS